MAQSIEITEVKNNGKELCTPMTKSYNTAFIDSTRVDGTGCEIFLGGRNTKDVRKVSETNAAVLAAANAAPTTDIEKLLALTVKAKAGDLESRITPYAMNVNKANIVEYFADPSDAADSIVIIATGKNSAERMVLVVDQTYAALKAKFLL
jgi:hypothetical protein